MNEYLIRFKAFPGRTFELAVSTTFANLLALAAPIFVILVLNKFISYGVVETLYTLSSGALLSVLFEYLFRRFRYGTADLICADYNKKLPQDSLASLISDRSQIFYLLPKPIIRRLINSYTIINKNYSAKNICVIIDAPFSVFFAAIIYILSPELGILTIVIIFVFIIIIIFSFKTQRQLSSKLKAAQNDLSSLNEFILSNIETIKVYDLKYVNAKYSQEIERQVNFIDSSLTEKQDNIQALIRGGTAVLTVLIVSMGAILVVEGALNIGEMIGINILAARALLPVIAITQQSLGWVQVEEARKLVKELDIIEREKSDGIAIQNFKSHVEIKGISFFYGKSITKIIDNLTFNVSSNKPLCIHGSNGSGKTTLAKILTGQLTPQGGDIFVDGISLKQISKTWWKQQIIYVPQIPEFFNGTLRENFLAYNNKLSANDIRKLIVHVGLEDVIDESPKGIDTNINQIRKVSSIGYRKRLAFARALAFDGKIVVIDDPTIGLDKDGSKIILEILTQMAASNKSIIVFSNDERVFRGCSQFLNLDDGPQADPKSIRNS